MIPRKDAVAKNSNASNKRYKNMGHMAAIAQIVGETAPVRLTNLRPKMFYEVFCFNRFRAGEERRRKKN